MTRFLVKLALVSVVWQVAAFGWFVVAGFVNYVSQPI